VGNKWREKGEVVKVPERVAKEAVIQGCAEPHGLTAAAAAWFAMPAEVPKTKPAEDYTSAKYQAPNIKILSGSIFQEGRSYTAADGAFYYKGNPLILLALQHPDPGSITADVARSGSRNMPVIELLRPLDEDGQKRLAVLKKNVNYRPPVVAN
jgi:hypothetical protein